MVVSIAIGAIGMTIIIAVAGFLAVGGIATIVPQINTYLLVLGSGFLAWMTKDIKVYSGEKWELTAGVIFAGIAATLMVGTYFNIPLTSFSGSLVQIVGQVQPGAIEGTGFLADAATTLEELGIQPMSLASIISVVGAVASIAFLVDAVVFKGTLLRRGQTKVGGRK